VPLLIVVKPRTPVPGWLSVVDVVEVTPPEGEEFNDDEIEFF
jgi:hypothetical protein